MKLLQRIHLLVKLGQYLDSNDPSWQKAKEKAYAENAWFLPDFIDIAVKNITAQYLQEDVLSQWVARYPGINDEDTDHKTVGLVMAGNIPLVGFHDFLCVFISGHAVRIKPSSKDEVLIRHLADKLISWEPSLSARISFESMLKGCDAYIATGSNNTGAYFNYYFGKYPSLIRRNRTSVAVLKGTETEEQLQSLADDVYLFFGLGCRNITKIYVPDGYDFGPILKIFSKYDYLAEIHKYKNNYDYNLALHILNNRFYMSNDSLLLVEDVSLYSPVSQLNYETYQSEKEVLQSLKNNPNLQCQVGLGGIPFGNAQRPGIDDYADGEDTMAFLLKL
jgi:hypothetical protein